MAGSETPEKGIYETEDLALMHDAIEAVCAELGIKPADHGRREAVAARVIHSWAAGGRTPLNLVNAGLNDAA